MATEVRRRRGTTTEHNSFTGAGAETTVDTTKDTVVVHDGSTVGGFPLLREDGNNNGQASTFRSNMGLAIGSDVQGWDSDLQDLSDNLTATASELNLLDGTLTTVRQNLGLAIGSDVQAWDADLDTYAATPLTAAELGELQNINSVTITNTQWGYLGSLDQDLGTGDSPTFAGGTFNGSVYYDNSTYSNRIFTDGSGDLRTRIGEGDGTIRNLWTGDLTDGSLIVHQLLTAQGRIVSNDDITSGNLFWDYSSDTLTIPNIVIGTTNLFPDNDPQALGTGDSPTFAGGTFTGLTTHQGGITSEDLSTINSSLLVRGQKSASSGEGLEFEYSSGRAEVFAYDRTNNNYKDLRLRGANITIGTGAQPTTFTGTVTAQSGVVSNDDITSGNLFWDYSSDTLDVPIIQTDTLRTTLFKPEIVSGISGETVFNAVSQVTDIDTTNTGGGNDGRITFEDAVFNNGDYVAISSGNYNSLGFSNTRIQIATAGSAVAEGTQHEYNVISGAGAESDISIGDTGVKADGNMIYVDARDGTVNGPKLQGYQNLTDFNDSPIGGANASPNWEITPEFIFYDGLGTSILAPEARAGYNQGDTVPSNELTNDEWNTQASSPGAGTFTNTERKLLKKYYHRYGYNKLIVIGHGRRNLAGGALSGVWRVDVTIDGTTTSTTATSAEEDFEIEIDLSDTGLNLTQNTYYQIDLEVYAEVEADGSGQACNALIREDIYMFTAT